MKYYVEIVEFNAYPDEDRVVKRMGPFSERKADRVDGGVKINLNHDDFYTRIVEE